MRKCYATAIVLISWYLMLPPPIFPPVKTSDGDYAVNSKAPLSQWLTLKKLSSQSECKAKLKTMPSFYRCVSSDDPGLKKTAAKPKSGPSTSTATGAVGTHMQ
jgi:hypothetical protein